MSSTLASSLLVVAVLAMAAVDAKIATRPAPVYSRVGVRCVDTACTALEPIDMLPLTSEPASALLRRVPALRAVADYKLGMNTTGWDTLNVTTSPHANDTVTAYAAGIAEGYATRESIWLSWLGGFALTANGSAIPANTAMPPKAVQFIAENEAYVRQMAAANGATDPYWHEVGLQMAQFDGIVDGYNQGQTTNASKLESMQIMFLVTMGDLMDIFTALGIMMGEEYVEDGARPAFASFAHKKDWRKMTKNEFNAWFVKRTHCSALVKLTDDLQDIFIGHATWSTFNMLYRIYKTYTLEYSTSKAKTVSFSSYPATLSSIDDYFTTSAGLVVTETSFSVYNMSIYNGNTVPKGTVLYWVRSQVASRMATTAQEWTDAFGKYNSGTYNNQWIVLDTKLFTPGQTPLQANTLRILEQMPGMIESQDVTTTLSYGYWPSYNVPSIRKVFDYAGYPEAVKTQGWQMNGYERNVRGDIFRRDQAKITDMASFQFMMQYNDYEQDPISEGDPVYAVASRGDLLITEPQCFGAVDAKVTSAMMMKANGTTLAFSGPTPQQPDFRFSGTKATIMCAPHFGVPDLWDFEFVPMTP